MITNGHDIQKHGEFPNGTSLQGYVTTTYDTLKRAFGIPHCFDGGKTNVEWVLLIDGVLATIYDWKETRIILGKYQWHIGGHSTEAVGLVQSVVDQLENEEEEAVTRGLVTAEEKEAPTVRAIGKREAGTWTVKQAGSKE